MSVDPLSAYVALLLQGGSITDASAYRRPVSVVGAVTPGADALAAAGSSLRFAGGRLIINSRFDLSGGVFSIEFWAKFSSISASAETRIVMFGANSTTSGFAIGVTTGGRIYCGVPSGATTNITPSGVVLVGSRAHYMITGNGTTTYIFVNGAVAYSGSTWRIPSGPVAAMYIGYDVTASVNATFDGTMDDFRLTIGTPRATAAFSPPTEALEIMQMRGAGLDADPAISGAASMVGAVSSGTGLSPVAGGPDIYFGGPGLVVGTVKVKPAQPVVRKVRLFRDRDGICVGESWSTAAGRYAFGGLALDTSYTAISYDHTGQFESVCASGLKATVVA